MKLNSLELRNFKGIKELSVILNSQDLNIYGDNGTGKTTVFDAFMWLLFDKDSSNSSNFNIKTLDKTGQVKSGLEHEVKASITLDSGKTVELQKIYKEKWTKKRGETEQALTGHNTDHYIDGVPKKKKEYTEFLEKIIDEETFRILTNPLHFNTKLEWKKRREVAMELVDQVEVEDVFNADKKIEELKNLLVDDLSVEDLKAKTQATKRKLNEKLKQIPVRIDELSRQDLDENIDFETLTKQKSDIEKQIDSIKNRTIDTEQLEKLKEEVSMLETLKRTFERDKTIALNEEYKSVNSRLQDVNKEANTLINDKQKIENEISLLESKISFKNEEIARLRTEYKEITSSEFDTTENVCKACGQELQEDKKEENIERFNSNIQTQIQKNIEFGKKVKSEIEELEEQIKEKKEEQVLVEGKLEEIQKRVTAIENNLDKIEKQLGSIDFNSFEEYQETSIKITKLNREIESILSDNKEKSQEQQDKLTELENRLSNTNTLLSKKEVIESNLKRVEELKEEERELAEQIAQLEKTEIQCEQFIITKAALLEDKLNSKFKLVKFKLFEEQMNGGINDIFTTTVNGVPFDDLNNAMKINAGLDIINTLTKHYSFNAPIFIDNRESVNEIIDIDSQVINLIVSDDKKLKIENPKIEGVA